MKKIENKIVLISILLGLLFWLGDAVGDNILKFPNESFFYILFRDGTYFDLILRPVVLLLFTVSGIVVSHSIKKVRETNERYQQLFENVNDGIFIRPSKTFTGREQFIEVNQRACEQLGYEREELLHLSPQDLVDPENANTAQVILEKLKLHGNILAETVLIKKDGSKMPAEINLRLAVLNGTPVSLSIVRDLSERQERGRALRDSERRLRILTERLLTVQEDERGRISRELHDSLGQNLMFLKLEIGLLQARLPKKLTSLKSDCAQLMAYVEETSENVRQLSQELKPWGLEEMGFSLAVKVLIISWCRLCGVRADSLELEEIDHLLTPRAQLNLYRVFQEALTNIGKHAEATEVSVTIKKRDGQILIRIQDNGRGIHLDHISSPNDAARGHGLSTMKERARLLGGALKIRGRPGKGTEISLAIPLQGTAGARKEEDNEPLSPDIG